MTGSMITFVTDGGRREEGGGRDGGNFKGPKCWSKKNKTICRFRKNMEKTTENNNDLWPHL